MESIEFIGIHLKVKSFHFVFGPLRLKLNEHNWSFHLFLSMACDLDINSPVYINEFVTLLNVTIHVLLPYFDDVQQ